jgi:hypothetical protein
MNLSFIHKGQYIFLCIIVLLSITGTITSGCSSDSEDLPASPDGDWVVKMMKNVPLDHNNLGCMDLVEMRRSSDFDNLYSFLKQQFFGGTGTIDWLGISIDDVNLFGANRAMQMSGEFDLTSIRNNLERSEFSKSTTDGSEVWINGAESVNRMWVIFLDNLLVIGWGENVLTSYLDVIQNREPTMYTDDMRDIIERLPDACSFGFGEDRLVTNSDYEGLSVSGQSFSTHSGNSMSFAWVCKFTSVDFATNAIDAIKTDLENDTDNNWQHIQVNSEGEFLAVTAELPGPNS